MNSVARAGSHNAADALLQSGQVLIQNKCKYAGINTRSIAQHSTHCRSCTPVRPGFSLVHGLRTQRCPQVSLLALWAYSLFNSCQRCGSRWNCLTKPVRMLRLVWHSLAIGLCMRHFRRSTRTLSVAMDPQKTGHPCCLAGQSLSRMPPQRH